MSKDTPGCLDVKIYRIGYGKASRFSYTTQVPIVSKSGDWAVHEMLACPSRADTYVVTHIPTTWRMPGEYTKDGALRGLKVCCTWPRWRSVAEFKRLDKEAKAKMLADFREAANGSMLLGGAGQEGE